jgi:hypothetical protein
MIKRALLTGEETHAAEDASAERLSRLEQELEHVTDKVGQVETMKDDLKRMQSMLEVLTAAGHRARDKSDAEIERAPPHLGAAVAPPMLDPCAHEERRLEVLRRYKILDTPPERDFDG